MKELRTKIVVLFTFLMLVAAWGFWWLQTALMPATIEAYPFIPLVFYFSGIVLVQTLYRLDKTNPRKLVNVYMLYILFETYVFYSFEKQIKKERK
jgi:hypothetical protein